MKYFNSITEIIGKTPILKLNSLSGNANLFAKCEFMNPTSIKDRTMFNIITQAEKKGLIKPGDTLIEATSGNTGIALASIATVKGYKVILTMSEIQSEERRKIMKSFGAEFVLTPASEGTAGARKKLFEICEEHPEYFYIGQHINGDNPGAHYKNTGPEIFEDLDGQIDIFVAGLGTGGTISGTGRYLKEKKPNVRVVGIEPFEAPFVSQGIFKAHHIAGIAPGFIPQTLDQSIIDEIALIKEEDAFAMCRRIAAEEGVLVGISSGAVAHIMLELSEKTEHKGKNIVGIFADSGEKYISVKGLFNS
jgi:cysteine synthase A